MLSSVLKTSGVIVFCTVGGALYTVHTFVVAPVVYITTGKNVFSKKGMKQFYKMNNEVKPKNP